MQENQENATATKGKFGITEDMKSKNAIPFKVTSAHPINAGTLIKVAFEEIKVKDKESTYGLVFYFDDETKERSHREVEWLLDEDDKKFQGKLAAFQSRMKHIYEEFAPFPKGGIATEALTVSDFYKGLEKAFNTNGVEGQPIFKNVPVWIKLTWYKGNLKFPYSPNFIERIKVGGDKLRKETNLVVNPKFDIMDNDAVAGAGKSSEIADPSQFKAADDEFASFPS